MMLCCLFTGQFADPKSVACREQFLVQHMLPASPVWPEVTVVVATAEHRNNVIEQLEKEINIGLFQFPHSG